MTILIHFHQIRYRDFKTYYTHYVQSHLKAEFPGLVSYNRLERYRIQAITVDPIHGDAAYIAIR